MFASFWDSSGSGVAEDSHLREQGFQSSKRGIAMQLKPIADRRLTRIKERARADFSRVQAYLPAQPARAEPEREERASERRRHKRVAVQSTMTVRRVGSCGFEVALEDISASGCRVVMLDSAVAGDPVVARLPQLEPLGSRVCWAEGTVTGVQFLRPMHPAVFDMLLTRLGAGTTLAA